jgi:[acyl-carrier-protein] S-malonyltransferase
MRPAFLFPGQSSRDPRVFERLGRVAPGATRATLARASERLGRDLAAHYVPENPAIFARNRDVQVGVFVANHVFLETLERAGVTATISAGLSLGEYNHLVHAGALDFEDALALVDARGAAYDEGPEGSMAAVFPLEREDVLSILERARAHGCIEIGNDNSPTQHVLTGARDAVAAAVSIAEEELYARAVVIEHRIPMHCSLFRPVAERYRAALRAAPLRSPTKPYVSNVLGAVVAEPTPDLLRELLERHVHEPVRFRESIEAIAARHPDAAFVEVGPRSVLHDLLDRRWRKEPRFKTDGEDVGVQIACVAKELSRGA